MTAHGDLVKPSNQIFTVMRSSLISTICICKSTAMAFICWDVCMIWHGLNDLIFVLLCLASFALVENGIDETRLSEC